MLMSLVVVVVMLFVFITEVGGGVGALMSSFVVDVGFVVGDVGVRCCCRLCSLLMLEVVVC